MIPIILKWIDILLFLYFGLSVIYLLIYAIFSRFKRSYKYPISSEKGRIVILFAAYNEDEVIESSAISFLKQNYPRNLYEVVIISDHMKDETNDNLSKLPIKLFKVIFKNSSKAKALNEAIRRLKNELFDIVVIMDADNIVEPTFLQKINNAYQSGAKAIQCHRQAKNIDTDVALLDAISEEINNSYFRKGHINAGLSSALSGSGMAFDYKWFCKNVNKLSSAGEDKELEVLLLKQQIFIEYLEDVPVYDEKIKTSSGFSKQRKRWIATQTGTLKAAISDLPRAIYNKNIDYVDKLIQWMMPPRILLLGFIGIMGLILIFINWQLSIKWWILLYILFLTLCLAIPKNLDNKRLESAIIKIPLLFVKMFGNLFRLKGINKNFQHTKHGN